jgi:hypothetical protein
VRPEGLGKLKKRFVNFIGSSLELSSFNNCCSRAENRTKCREITVTRFIGVLRFHLVGLTFEGVGALEGVVDINCA